MKSRSVTASPMPTPIASSTSAVAAPVTVSIDELVLVGFDRASATELVGEIRKALSRALAEQELPAWWDEAGHPYMNHPYRDDRHVAHLDISIGATDSPARLAQTLAETLAAQLGGGTTDSGGGEP